MADPAYQDVLHRRAVSEPCPIKSEVLLGPTSFFNSRITG